MDAASRSGGINVKLSISNIAWTAQTDRQVYDLMKKYGYTGLEIAPTRIFPENPYGVLENAQKWAQELKNEYGFEVPSMQSIWFGRNERLFGSDKEKEMLLSYTKLAVDFAAAVGCGNLVFGSPKNRVLPDNAAESARRSGIEFFKAVGNYADENKTVVGIEANPAIYNTNYINTTAEALELIKSVESDGFLLNLDAGTMVQNAEKIEILEGNIGYINHVHISEPFLAPVVMSAERRSFHEELSCFLKENDYGRYISIEMGKVEDGSLISEILAYVKEIFG